MSDQVTISCRVTATGPGLTFTARLDDLVVWQGDPTSGHDLKINLHDDDAKHVLIFELSGKTIEHTKVDESGNIMQDVTITISDLTFDEIPLDHLMVERAVYRHDFNGTGTKIDDQFYGVMGCNGTVSLEFTTPMYLWLLENM